MANASTVTSSWYTLHESPMRMAIWHAGNTVANILSGFLAAGILENMDGVVGLHAWQWFFLIEGIASIAVAIMAYFVLPGWPSDTNATWPSKKGFLSEQESEMAQYRVLLSNGGRDERVGGTWDGLKEALVEPLTWMFCAMHFGLTISQSYKDFLPSVRKLGLAGHLTIQLTGGRSSIRLASIS
jgi:MFS family permease